MMRKGLMEMQVMQTVNGPIETYIKNFEHGHIYILTYLQNIMLISSPELMSLFMFSENDIRNDNIDKAIKRGDFIIAYSRKVGKNTLSGSIYLESNNGRTIMTDAECEGKISAWSRVLGTEFRPPGFHSKPVMKYIRSSLKDAGVGVVPNSMPDIMHLCSCDPAFNAAYESLQRPYSFKEPVPVDLDDLLENMLAWMDTVPSDSVLSMDENMNSLLSFP